MKTYEITYLTLAEEGFDAASVSEALSANGATIVSVHPWGARRRLAYPIKKNDQAFYTTVVFDAETSAVKPIERALNLSNDVLRCLIVEFEPGMFQRLQAQGNETSAPKEEKAEVATPVETEEAQEVTESAAETSEETTSEAPATETSTEEPVGEEKPKAKRAPKKSADEQKELDEKIDALLNEDIA